MKMKSLLLSLLVVVGASAGGGGYSNNGGGCSPTKMKALLSVYETNAKILELKSNLEKELLDTVLASPDLREVSKPSPGVTSSRDLEESRAMRERRLEGYRHRLGDVIKNIESGKVTLPVVENMNTSILKGIAERMPLEASEFTIDKYVSTHKQIYESDELLEAWVQHLTLDRTDPRVAEQGAVGIRGGVKPMTMDCDIKSRSFIRPTSVHKLRPGDIDVVGAMGDSITAGFGAGASFLQPWEWLSEYRGQSWSAGGDNSFGEGYTTLPNILREFNPNLKGYSTGVIGLFEEPLTSEKTQMNAAITGDIAQAMTSQAERLVEKLKNDPEVDMQNDWKMVTMFIGANDLCGFCTNDQLHTAEAYVAELQKGLDILKYSIPRLYVNLIEIFDIVPLTEVADFGLGTMVCSAVHSLGNVCPCVRDQEEYDYVFDPAVLKARSDAYVKGLNKLIDSGRYDDTDDFTVVIQPFFRETGPPLNDDGEPDMSYFAQDCFHFSTKGQNRAGVGLWNSIIKPVGKKPTTWDIDELPECPEMEYLPTKKNSCSGVKGRVKIEEYRTGNI